MKALTMSQPFASMIANGTKWIENRVWPTSYRGPIAKTGRTSEAIPYFQKLTKLLPREPVGWYGLGEAFMAEGQTTEADAAFRKVIELSPDSPIGDASRSALTKLAEMTLRQNEVLGERRDAVYYCLGALQSFAKMKDDQIKQVMLEIATKGEQGLDINNPEVRYTFRNIEGDFSGLKAVCYMYVAMQRYLPGVNAGIDLSKEYAKATAMFKNQG